MIPYALTRQDFSNYSVPMEAELAALEEKVRLATQLCVRLREENNRLRQQLSVLETDRKKLSEKIDGARNRVENLLLQFPE